MGNKSNGQKRARMLRALKARFKAKVDDGAIPDVLKRWRDLRDRVAAGLPPVFRGQWYGMQPRALALTVSPGEKKLGKRVVLPVLVHNSREMGPFRRPAKAAK